MNTKANDETPAVLTIAGSDSGGGAGLQADLKVFHALGCFGTTAITCVTAQNPDEVRGVEPVSPAMVAEQVRTVCAGFPIRVAKTGMLYSAEIIEAVADVVDECEIPLLVVDPVMVSTSGARLLREDAIAALLRRLIPKARVITPNLPEAEVLVGHTLESLDALQAAAEEIFRVLRPGGRLLFFEHVRAEGGGLAWFQDRMNPLWNIMSCGCNLNRDTRGVFEEAGFRFEWIEEDAREESKRPRLPLIKGVAVRPE